MTTLVVGPDAARREAAIAQALELPDLREDRVAILLEGMPSGTSPFESSENLLISRIAPGCLCCAGNLVMRVTLNRLLRQRPARLFIGVASAEHLDQLRSWLSTAPYDQLLALTPDLDS
ncbi:GTPase [Massilia sp. Dwa41.01b]|uniref:GTPase n=1 Tax=unclassified Massilia TaxID=2609279 RepID=UPI0016046DA3|nr:MULTISPECIES: GTPase [unclassified Massilia]QNA87853.1 GTPase [Massilia sp. Dwa41.01b]QNA98755.1 GTPase [Massilia sp. Se16.2.3]